MDSTLLTFIASAVTGIVAMGGSVLVVRRYQKLGGGEAQEKLNTTYRELNEAFGDQVGVLKGKIAELELERLELRRERLRLQQDIDDLRAQVRALQSRAKRGEARTQALEDEGGGS